MREKILISSLPCNTKTKGPFKDERFLKKKKNPKQTPFHPTVNWMMELVTTRCS